MSNIWERFLYVFMGIFFLNTKKLYKMEVQKT